MKPNLSNLLENDGKSKPITPYVDTVIKKQKRELSVNYSVFKETMSRMWSNVKTLAKFKLRKTFSFLFKRSQKKKFDEYKRRNNYILNYRHNSKLNDDILVYAKEKLSDSDTDFEITFDLDKKSNRIYPVVNKK